MSTHHSTGKRDPTSPLQSEELKKTRTWSQVASSEYVDVVSESNTTTDIVHSMDTQAPIHTVTLDQASIAAIVELVAAQMESRLSFIVSESIQKALAPMEADMATVKRENPELRQHSESLAVRVSNLETQVDEMEQYSRRNCLRISGITDQPGESTDSIVLQIASELGANLTSSDIDRSHRVGRPRPRQPGAPSPSASADYSEIHIVLGTSGIIRETEGDEIRTGTT